MDNLIRAILVLNICILLINSILVYQTIRIWNAWDWIQDHWKGSKENESNEPADEDDSSLDDLKFQLEMAATGDLPVEKPDPDDSTYEFIIGQLLTKRQGSMCYTNYTKATIQISGELVQNGCVHLLSHQQVESGQGATMSLEEWDDVLDATTRFVFRIFLAGENYLIWGVTREDAYLNLYDFLTRR